MAIQLIGMLLHRFSTVGHYVSRTKISHLFKKKSPGNHVYEKIEYKYVSEFVKMVIKNVLSDDGQFCQYTSIEQAVIESLKKISGTRGDQDKLRRMSRYHGKNGKFNEGKCLIGNYLLMIK